MNDREVVKNLKLTYAMLEAVEDFCEMNLSDAKAAVAWTTTEYLGIPVDFEKILAVEKGKRHNRKGASDDRRLRIVREPEDQFTPASFPPDTSEPERWEIRRPGPI